MSYSAIDDHKIVLICSPSPGAAICNLAKELPDAPILKPDHMEGVTIHFGTVVNHKVVIARLLENDSTTAAIVADHLRMTLNPKQMFFITTGGGISTDGRIRLGDVVVGSPRDTYAGVVAFSKSLETDQFEKVGVQYKPADYLLALVSSIESCHLCGENPMPNYISALVARDERYEFPGRGNDPQQCDESCGSRRDGDNPVIHYGTIASGDEEIKDANTRDRLSKKFGALCVERAAAGVTCGNGALVICGISNYADGSNDESSWGLYAAASAVAYLMQLLSKMR